jgi:ABC-type transport system involved in Fe-S cluster assembly fused permease/ATPase subunit
VTTTAWRTQFRKQANAADNIAASKAVDSLINFEAVKVCLFMQKTMMWPLTFLLYKTFPTVL